MKKTIEKLFYQIKNIIKTALKEDIGKGDITTAALVGKFESSGAVITVKEDCVVSGLQVAEWVMAQVDLAGSVLPARYTQGRIDDHNPGRQD